jgi:hypothetical protein
MENNEKVYTLGYEGIDYLRRMKFVKDGDDFRCDRIGITLKFKDEYFNEVSNASDKPTNVQLINIEKQFHTSLHYLNTRLDIIKRKRESAQDVRNKLSKELDKDLDRYFKEYVNTSKATLSDYGQRVINNYCQRCRDLFREYAESGETVSKVTKSSMSTYSYNDKIELNRELLGLYNSHSDYVTMRNTIYEHSQVIKEIEDDIFNLKLNYVK